MTEDILLVLAMITDTFFVSLSYACANIKIPILSAVIISFVSSAVLAASLYLARSAGSFFPEEYCRIFGALILGIIGGIQFCQNRLKAVLKKRSGNGSVSFSCFNLDFVISVYLDETQADSDHSKILSAKESFALAFTLSLDSLCAGMAAGICKSNIIRIAVMSFLLGLISVAAGKKLGKTNIIQTDLSWLSGLFLIFLAVIKLL